MSLACDLVQNFVEEIEMATKKTKIYVDNNSYVALAKNLLFHNSGDTLILAIII